MDTYIRNLADITQHDTSIAGGKAACLGEMLHAGLPVPDGFVVLTKAYDDFSLHEPSQELIAAILQAFDHLGAEHVAVRSSATAEDGDTAAWAGQLESYLYVTREELIDAVQKSWQSLSSPRALAYRHQKWLDKLRVSVAVVVQRMVPADVAGVAFTTNPVTGNHNELMIEAVHGDNHQLVNGHITPDNYIVNKASGKALWSEVVPQETFMRRGRRITVPKQFANEAKLDEYTLGELVALCKKIEQHFGKPQDIEWAFDGSQFYILQARPITTLHV